MSEINNVSANSYGGYVSNSRPVFRSREAVAYQYSDNEEYDSFERSDKKSTGEKVAVGSAIVVPLTLATLWLTKGKGWAKIKGLFNPQSASQLKPKKPYSKPVISVSNWEVKYIPPTEEEAKVIRRINTEAKRKSDIAHQVQNNIPEEQKQVLAQVREKLRTPIVDRKNLNGLFKTKDGHTVTLKDGNIQQIVLADGRKITKPATLYKYQDKIDLANLEAV